MFRFFLIVAALVLSACASTSVPSNFVYETSVRGEQGFIGARARHKSATTLLAAGQVRDPEIGLKAALPDAVVKVKRWGLTYFPKNWARYSVILEADIRQADQITKCRLRSAETAVGARTLDELQAKNGLALQKDLEVLISACAEQADKVKTERRIDQQ